VLKLDPAIRRPGRFDKLVTLDYPDHSLLPKALRWQLGADLPEADLSEAAIAAIGMSGAELAAAVRTARAKARSERRPLLSDDLTAAITLVRPPLSEHLHWRVAIHEAGHAVVGTATGRARPTSIAIVSTGGFATQCRQKGAGNRDGPAPVLFRSGAHVRRPSVRRPQGISSRGLSVCVAGCRSR
jgi:ATP-dependent Zn protease